MLNNPPPIEQEFPKFPKIYNWYMTKRQERFGVKLNINQIVDSYLKIPILILEEMTHAPVIVEKNSNTAVLINFKEIKWQYFTLVMLLQ